MKNDYNIFIPTDSFSTKKYVHRLWKLLVTVDRKRKFMYMMHIIRRSYISHNFYRIGNPLVETFIVPSLRHSVQEVLDNALRGVETSNYGKSCISFDFCLSVFSYKV